MANIKKILSVIIVAAIFISVAILLFNQEKREKPKLALMTSIPLVLGEVGVEQMVQGQSDPAPAYDVLKENYDILPLDVIDDRLSDVKMLLMAQARPLRGSELVALDQWVRDGGHIVILSDAALQWPSEYSLGDKRRPLFASLLSPLFKYWGLEQLLLLDDPSEHSITIDEHHINTVTPSEWRQVKGQAPQVKCTLNANKFEANCRIGKGRAILIGDSDFINADYWRGFGLYGDDANMEYLLDRLMIADSK